MKKKLILGLLGLYSVVASASNVTAYFEVTLPPHFINYRSAYVSGDVDGLGKWEPKAVPLTYRDGKLYGSASVPQGTVFSYKVNLGNWFYSEVLENGKDAPNRQGYCQRDCMLKVNVSNIRLKQFHPRPQSAGGQFHYLHDVYFPTFGNYRSVVIYLPPGYERSRQRFPVVYALDGNNLFDVATASSHAEWRMDETLNYYIQSGKIPPVIVVGIYNTKHRGDEYLLCRHNGLGGGARAYAEFLMTSIKPVVDRYYRTLPDRENTSILGSSFGGSFALFASHYLANFASRFGAMSPALWFGNYCIADLLKQQYKVRPKRVWLDMGDREGWDDGAIHFKNGVQDVQQAWQWIHQYGQPEDVRVYVHKGGIHHESDWGKRIAGVLSYLLH